jgi:murein DD-endopeptidase MepM/ murein hydrolase activator NlpD
VLLALAVGLGAYLFTRFEGTPPSIETATDEIWVGNGGAHQHTFRLSAAGTGVQEAVVWLDDGSQPRELARQAFAGDVFRGAAESGVHEIAVQIDPKALGLKDGHAVLRAEARDFSWRANRVQVEIPLAIDTRAPRLSVQTGLTYAQPGGTRVVVYSISEDAARHGVEVGDKFFPGYPHPSQPGMFAALYALPLEAGPVPRVVAEDRAGNRASAATSIHMLPRPRPGGAIELDDEFMATKVDEILGKQDGSTLEAYLKINRDVRRENAQKIRELCRTSSPQILWSGAFDPLPNGETREKFGVRRTYRYQGREVDQQVHLGLDFASLSHADVPAANSGNVIFAGDLGIYGNTILIDHGLGLFSLYAHLSDMAVAAGDSVTKGELLGHTGTSGLAGGDHLHFSVLVDGEFVEPEEWIDPKWIQDHVYARLGTAEAAVPAAPAEP